MKKISYKYCVKVNYGKEETPNYVDTFVDKTLNCYTDEEYEKSLPIAQLEAYNGEYTIEEVADPEPEPTPSGDDSAVWDELDAAYQEGVDSV